MTDSVNNPSHYAGGRTFEPIDVIRDWGLNFNLGNVVKYVSRVDRKVDSLEDLKKARAYLDHEIQKREEGSEAGLIGEADEVKVLTEEPWITVTRNVRTNPVPGKAVLYRLKQTQDATLGPIDSEALDWDLVDKPSTVTHYQVYEGS